MQGLVLPPSLPTSEGGSGAQDPWLGFTVGTAWHKQGDWGGQWVLFCPLLGLVVQMIFLPLLNLDTLSQHTHGHTHRRTGERKTNDSQTYMCRAFSWIVCYFDSLLRVPWSLQGLRACFSGAVECWPPSAQEGRSFCTTWSIRLF